jgi:hypothetical protein
LSRQTDTQFVLDLMTLSKHGALSQAFVIEALASYSKLVLNSSNSDDSSLVINNKMWKAIAKEIEEKITAKYGIL